MSLTVNLPHETEERLRKKASLQGQSLGSCVQGLLQLNAQTLNGSLSPSTRMDFEGQLDALVAGLPSLPVLPADFARRDIYLEHE